jgi:hypothetical protein
MAPNTIPTDLIAPCGMNCRLCRAFQRDKNTCPGCRADDSALRASRARCRIRTCESLAAGRAKYCVSCPSFPCQRLRHLDKRYRTRYGMSMIDNLTQIRTYGVRHFVTAQKARWTCPGCGALLCVHDPECPDCRQHRADWDSLPR